MRPPWICTITVWIGAILAMTVISLLFNISGLEVALHRDIDLNRELRTAGLANLIAGFVGGTIGYPVLSLTMLNQRIGQGSRPSSTSNDWRKLGVTSEFVEKPRIM